MKEQKVRWLKITDVCEIIQLCQQTVYRYMKMNYFPKPVVLKFGNYVRNRWLAADIRKWVDLVESGMPVADIKWDQIKQQEEDFFKAQNADDLGPGKHWPR